MLDLSKIETIDDLKKVGEIGNISEAIENNKSLMVIGKTGTGKSYFTNLLKNLIDPSKIILSFSEEKLEDGVSNIKIFQNNTYLNRQSIIENFENSNLDNGLTIKPDFIVFDEIRSSSEFNLAINLSKKGYPVIANMFAANIDEAKKRILFSSYFLDNPILDEEDKEKKIKEINELFGFILVEKDVKLDVPYQVTQTDLDKFLDK